MNAIYEPTIGFTESTFWRALAEKGESVALVEADGNRSWSYRALARCVADVADALPVSRRGVLFLFGENDLGGIVGYLAGLLARHVVYLISIRFQHPSVVDLLERYKPELVLTRSAIADATLGHQYTYAAGFWGYRCFVRKCQDAPDPHPNVALLMSTSASTGNPKTVRISTRALAASACQVVEALRITSEDHAVTSLPFTHIYGLSVVNSHLAAGARLVIEKRSVADPEFWCARNQSPWTTLAGVTATYELMRERKVSADTLRGMRKLLHSGDRLPPQVFSWLYSNFSETQASIFLMYGQTEATGRMSVLPPELLPDCSASVGCAVPRGSLSISSDQEIVFSGPNVMMGYARDREDLSPGGELTEGLHTGDSGYLERGLLYIAGRRGRTCKVFGQRVSLEDVENQLRDLCPVAVVSNSGNLLIVFEGAESEIRARVLQLSRTFRLPPQAFLMRKVTTLPRTSTGKICYRDLEASFGSTSSF
jgi:acyl-CoA synthetase (AMP-forming)/AMP-acid ligase II